MISVGIDVSKGKSTVCILKPYGEIVSKPFNITHTQKDLSELSSMLFRLNDEVKIVMEATGIYHLPVLTYLQEKGFFVSVINPLMMKRFCRHSPFLSRTGNVLHNSINWLSHAHPLQKENIPLHSCNLQILHGL